MPDHRNPADASLDKSAAFEQIDSLCSSFLKGWKQELRPSLEAFLNRVDGKAQTTLMRNLLPIEIEFRRRNNERPNSAEYIRRFPKYASLIRQAFFESTMMSIDGDQDLSEVGLTLSISTPATSRLGEYQLVQELGRGGFGIVYEARHTKRGNRVALKTLPIGMDRHGLGDAERLHKFRREFRSLADINHPHLVGMQSLEVDGNQWFFTMDLVDGVDFYSYVRPKGELDESRLRKVLPQLANGILALHGQHILHRDLKPSNVLVDEGGKVTILDFGLVVELQQRTDQTASLQSGRFAGTPIYAAPEQVVGRATASSDWYSFGVMLYESLTGEKPFSGSAMEILDQKRSLTASKLANRTGIPMDLAGLTDRLLKIDPDERAEPLDIAQTLFMDSESISTGSADDELKSSNSEGRQTLIGREQQRTRLDEIKQFLLDGQIPWAVFINGKSGEGKTALAEAFLSSLSSEMKILVLSGRCYDRESVPFKAIDSVIDSLVTFLRGKSDEEIAGLLPPDIRLLAHLFPILNRVPTIGDISKTNIPGLDSKQIRYRAFGALKKLMKNISERTPMVMFIDDLQWGDADSAETLFRMLSPPEAPAMVLLGSYRSDEADESPFLIEWNNQVEKSEPQFQQQAVSVGPLSELQCVELVTQRIGLDNEMIQNQAKRLFQSTGGNPYFLDQLIDCFDPETGSFSPLPLHEVITGRLDRLPAEARPLLEVIAVSGQALSISEASSAAGQSAPTYATVTHMRTERLLRLLGSEEQELVDTYHDKIRETVLERLGESEGRRLHLRLGETIEASESLDGEQVLSRLANNDPELKPPPRIFDLAYHFERAKNRDKAFAYAILAAEQATSQFALPIAIENYRTAEKYLDSADEAIKYRVNFGFGIALSLAAQYEAANEKLEQAVKFASDQQEAIRAKAQQADIIYKTGSLRASIKACEQLLAELGLPVPRTRVGRMWSRFKSRFFRFLENGFGKTATNQAPAERPKISLTVEVLLRYAYPTLFLERESCLWAISLAYDFARSIGDKRLLSLAATFQSLGASMLYCNEKASERYFEESIGLAEELNDTYCMGVSLFHGGTLLGSFGRFREAESAYEAAVEKWEAIGDVWRKTFTRNNYAFHLMKMGKLNKARHIAREVFQTAIQFGQPRLAQNSLCPWGFTTNKKFPFEELTDSFQVVPDDLLGTAWLKTSEADWHLKNDRWEEATVSAEAAMQAAKGLSASSGLSCSAFAVYAHVVRQHARALESSDPPNSLRLKRKAFQAAKRAMRITRKSTVDLSFALRELAIHYFESGKTKKALRHILESCAIAKRQEAGYEYAKSLLVCGQVGASLGIPEADQQIEEAKLLLDNFEKQLEQGHDLSSAWINR